MNLTAGLLTSSGPGPITGHYRTLHIGHLSWSALVHLQWSFSLPHYTDTGQFLGCSRMTAFKMSWYQVAFPRVQRVDTCLTLIRLEPSSFLWKVGSLCIFQVKSQVFQARGQRKLAALWWKRVQRTKKKVFCNFTKVTRPRLPSNYQIGLRATLVVRNYQEVDVLRAFCQPGFKGKITRCETSDAWIQPWVTTKVPPPCALFRHEHVLKLQQPCTWTDIWELSVDWIA